VLAVIPGLALIVVWITIVWTLITTVVAVRQALDYRSTPRAIGVCLIGWFVQTALLVLLGRLARPL
jgi:succinate-acetate transporter protein